jgi:RNA polymerase sigma-70 factor (ECF subfamily)
MGQSTLVQHPELVTLAVARAKEGDTNAVHFLYVRFADDVCGYVNSIVGSLDDSRNITKSVFGKLMTTIQRYEPREVPFAAWILRVSRNAALDHLVARDDAQLRHVLLCLQDRRLPRPRQIRESGGPE